MVLESHVKLSMKIFLPPKLGKWAKNRVFSINWKIWSLILLNLIIMKIHIICCLPAQIPYLGKFLFLRYGPKMFSANQIAGFFNQPYLQNKSMTLPNFLHVDTNSHKLKVDQKNLGWAWSEMGVASLVTGL